MPSVGLLKLLSHSKLSGRSVNISTLSCHFWPSWEVPGLLWVTLTRCYAELIVQSAPSCFAGRGSGTTF